MFETIVINTHVVMQGCMGGSMTDTMRWHKPAGLQSLELIILDIPETLVDQDAEKTRCVCETLMPRNCHFASEM